MRQILSTCLCQCLSCYIHDTKCQITRKTSSVRLCWRLSLSPKHQVSPNARASPQARTCPVLTFIWIDPYHTMPNNATVFWCILLLARLLRDPKHKVSNNATDLKHVLIQVPLLVNATGRTHAFIQVPLSLDPEHKVSEKVTDLQHVCAPTVQPKCQTMRQTSSMCLGSTTQSVRQCDRPPACAWAAQHKVSDNATDLQHVLVQHNTECQIMRQTSSICLYIHTDVPSVGSNKVPP